jgi:hypothetical protein
MILQRRLLGCVKTVVPTPITFYPYNATLLNDHIAVHKVPPFDIDLFMVSYLIFYFNGGSAMKRVWDTVGLVTCWSLAYNESQLLKTKPPRNHLGYAHDIPCFCCDNAASILNFLFCQAFWLSLLLAW